MKSDDVIRIRRSCIVLWNVVPPFLYFVTINLIEFETLRLAIKLYVNCNAITGWKIKAYTEKFRV